MNENPLWMPRGSIRGIIAIALIGAAIASVFTIGATDSAPIITLAGVVATFYFDSRTSTS